MAVEIERKFLVAGESWRAAITQSVTIRQGYLVADGVRSVRVRTLQPEAGAALGFLTIKAAREGASRPEYEYPIPHAEATELLEKLCDGRFIEKTRHSVPYAGHTWEIDEFHGDNAGLVVAELELRDEQEPFDRPVWLGREVTCTLRYYNSRLLKHPYKSWPQHKTR